jgi:hypothetical protein
MVLRMGLLMRYLDSLHLPVLQYLNAFLTLSKKVVQGYEDNIEAQDLLARLCLRSGDIEPFTLRHKATVAWREMKMVIQTISTNLIF